MKYDVDNTTLTIVLADNIDAANSQTVDDEIQSIISDTAYKSLVFNAIELNYISSMGLRIILKYAKQNSDFKIINVKSSVYEIFEMTGFVDIINIEKAYRELSVDGCEIIGSGSNGTVYRYNADTIIKVHNSFSSIDDINRERELSRKAFIMGIPTAIPYDIVKVGDRFGSVFELLDAKPFADVIKADPENIEKYADISTELLLKMHSTQLEYGEIADMRDIAIGWVTDLKAALSPEYYDKLLKLVSDIPKDNHLMHGDFHIKNIMIQNGEPFLIDMDTLCLGNPVFELASMYFAYVATSELDANQVERFLGISRELSLKFWNRTITRYFNTEDKEILAKQENKARVLAYARILRRTIRRGSFDDLPYNDVIDHCTKNLLELLDKTDTLIF